MIQHECEADFEAHMNQEQEARAGEFTEEIYSKIDKLSFRKDEIQKEIDLLRKQLP